MELSLSAAARMTGKAKATIHRAVKTGKLSARRDDSGVYHIDPSELARVFPLDVRETSQRDAANPSATPSEQDPLLVQEVAFLKEALARERETVDDLRTRLTRAEDHVRTLAHQAPNQVQPKAPSLGFIGRLLGRR
jgi:hypothetical protein